MKMYYLFKIFILLIQCKVDTLKSLCEYYQIKKENF